MSRWFGYSSYFGLGRRYTAGAAVQRLQSLDGWHQDQPRLLEQVQLLLAEGGEAVVQGVELALDGSRVAAVQGAQEGHGRLFGGAGRAAPMLCALGARVRLVAKNEERVVPLESIYRDDGIRYLAKRPEEILAEVLLPRSPAPAAAAPPS